MQEFVYCDPPSMVTPAEREWAEEQSDDFVHIYGKGSSRLVRGRVGSGADIMSIDYSLLKGGQIAEGLRFLT